MTTLNTYLTFEGNCENAFNFYCSVFGGEFGHVGRFSDMPDDPKYPVADDVRNQIMHISLPISKECVLMGSDTGGHGGPLTVGNNFSISVSTDSKEKADNFFEKLSEGGSVTMPMDNTFWGDYFGMLTDRFGINWMVGFNEQEQNV